MDAVGNVMDFVQPVINMGIESPSRVAAKLARNGPFNRVMDRFLPELSGNNTSGSSIGSPVHTS